MLDILYNVFVLPIELIVEMTFSVMLDLLGGYGRAIIAVSIVIQLLVLPLYKIADGMQDEERQKIKNMSKWVEHIKKTFKGDERYMILSTYYRQQNYKPWHALKSTVSLLIQVPFFIAGYHYLSNLDILCGKSFLFINDLSKPDNAIVISGIIINVLPIVMTIINVISSLIYTNGLAMREKMQAFILAIFFLVVLYDSPAGLVLYWTVNNMFSLCKNIVFKIFKTDLAISQVDDNEIFANNVNNDKYIFLISAFSLVIYMGVIIPLDIIKSSPSEFVSSLQGPLDLCVSGFTSFFGVFIFWGGLIFYLGTKNIRKIVGYIYSICLLCGAINYTLFGNQLGRMSALLVYDENISFGYLNSAINFLTILFTILVVLIVINKNDKLFIKLLSVLLISEVIIVMINSVGIKKQIDRTEQSQQVEDNSKILKLNKNGKNTIIIMLDRAISGYLPFIFDEKPEIKAEYDGFVYYSNTISFGKSTNFASPAIYGGYEYTPVAMNRRETELLEDKHNEALLVLPKLYLDAGYEVTVCDPPYAGYEWTPDLSIYKEYNEIKAYNTEGKYTEDYYLKFEDTYVNKQRRSFLYHSFMKMAPLMLQKNIYRDGEYFSQEIPVKKSFLDCYSVLSKLSELTDITDSDNNSFVQIQNGTTHEVALLKTPEYEPDEKISIKDFPKDIDSGEMSKELEGKVMKLDNLYQLAHYQDNVAALIKLGEWFEYLKANNCWNNTKIIIVSDHGNNIKQFDYMVMDDGLDIEGYNPLLLVKDYDSKGFIESKEFMTNADVPTIALKDNIDNPINPFTGEIIDNKDKKYPQFVTTSENYNTAINNGTIFDTSDGDWYKVSPGNIFDPINWEKIDEAH